MLGRAFGATGLERHLPPVPILNKDSAYSKLILSKLNCQYTLPRAIRFFDILPTITGHLASSRISNSVFLADTRCATVISGLFTNLKVKGEQAEA
jgi:hypothetical protein